MFEDETPEADSNLGEEVYAALLKDILAARLPGGTPIQQRRLALQYEVSRSPMRHALSRLEGEGLLVRDDTAGLVVRTITLRDYLDSLEMRMLLEPAAAAKASGNPDRPQLEIIQQRFLALQENPAPNLEDVWSFDDELHDYIALQSGNSFMFPFVRDLRRYTTIFERQMPVIRIKPGMREHAAVLEALLEGEAEVARAAMSFHLEIVRTGVLKRY
jgi:DNA-binding GntR family transcriptional regulator